MRRLAGLWLSLMLLAGCAVGVTTTFPPPPARVTITLADGGAEPNGERIELLRGQHLVLTITSDRDDEIHVHGFDLEIPVTAGQTVTEEIVMDRVGRFEVESHDPVFTVLVLQIR